ncbi:MAG: CDP-glucose 4,6-dehydratase [Bacteroidetes bacterium]|nr:CDP-glucose 4,6-dehydratase [Bacteroidota bacterium]MCL1968100.1 CDP-glucose 4,6-dehydratase [Bacteroidota bacterium]
MNNIDIFDHFYKGKKVFITGHTGFKGSWLSLWLHELGAEVTGFALAPYTVKDNFVLSELSSKINDIRGDIRNAEFLDEKIQQVQPDIIFHLAAQPLVRLSYQLPVETYQTNLMGTLHVMESFRRCASAKVAVMITTDKCYENKEQMIAYSENEPMGGYDPYSSSKGAAELAIASWRNSFINPNNYINHGKTIASARAGNVIGGGDWTPDRIIPDCIRALEAHEDICIRNPKAIRPWQHVLEPLSGYLLLASKMWQDPTGYCEGWNFGPDIDAVENVWSVASKVIQCYGKGTLKEMSDPKAPHEANLLMLDIHKAKSKLNWHPKLNIDKTIEMTIDWYRNYQSQNVYKLCLQQIQQYCL